MLAPRFTEEPANVVLARGEHADLASRRPVGRRCLRPIFTPLCDRAAPALRQPRLADVTSVQDQPVVTILAELVRRELLEAPLDLFDVGARCEPGSVRDPEYVRVHR